MPGRIVVAVVAGLAVYGFLGCEGRFAELLRILEEKGEPVHGVIGGRQRGCCRISVTNLATKVLEPIVKGWQVIWLWVAWPGAR